MPCIMICVEMIDDTHDYSLSLPQLAGYQGSVCRSQSEHTYMFDYELLILPVLPALPNCC